MAELLERALVNARESMIGLKRLRLTALVLLMGPAIVDPPEWTALKVLWEIMALEYEEYKKLEAGLNG